MNNLVAVDHNRDYRTEVMDEIPRTYYPGRGFLTDQEVYPTDLLGFGDLAFSPGPMLAGRYGDLLAKSPSFEIPQGQGRNPDYSIYNDPRMPGARNLRRKLEGILGLPRIEFPKV